MPADRTPLRPLRTEPYRLKRQTRNPDCGEQVACAASHYHVRARLATAHANQCPDDKDADDDQHNQQLCTHISSLACVPDVRRGERPGNPPGPLVVRCRDHLGCRADWPVMIQIEVRAVSTASAST